MSAGKRLVQIGAKSLRNGSTLLRGTHSPAAVVKPGFADSSASPRRFRRVGRYNGANSSELWLEDFRRQLKHARESAQSECSDEKLVEAVGEVFRLHGVLAIQQVTLVFVWSIPYFYGIYRLVQ